MGMEPYNDIDKEFNINLNSLIKVTIMWRLEVMLFKCI